MERLYKDIRIPIAKHRIQNDLGLVRRHGIVSTKGQQKYYNEMLKEDNQRYESKKEEDKSSPGFIVPTKKKITGVSYL